MKRICTKILVGLLVFTLLYIPIPSPVHALECYMRDADDNKFPIPCNDKGMIFGLVIIGGAIAASTGVWLYKKISDGIDNPVRRSKKDGLQFYEGNNCTEQVVGSVWTTDQPPRGPASVNVKKAWFKNDLGKLGIRTPWFENDEARSLLIKHATAGEVIRVFDSPEGSERDDWTEITIWRNIHEDKPYCVGSFEQEFWLDDFIMLVHHRKNGLDGKVSRVETDHIPNLSRWTFPQPRHNGHRLDVCASFSESCGWPAAQRWCQMRGFTQALSFEVEEFRPTITLQEEICDDWFCSAFSKISCISIGTSPGSRDYE